MDYILLLSLSKASDLELAVIYSMSFLLRNHFLIPGFSIYHLCVCVVFFFVFFFKCSPLKSGFMLCFLLRAGRVPFKYKLPVF